MFIICSSIEIITRVFFWGKYTQTPQKTMVVDRKKKNRKLWLWSPQRQISLCTLNFLPSTKKTTEYSFEVLFFDLKLFFKRNDFLPRTMMVTQKHHPNRLPPPPVCTDERTGVHWRHNQNFSHRDVTRFASANGAPLCDLIDHSWVPPKTECY